MAGGQSRTQRVTLLPEHANNMDHRGKYGFNVLFFKRFANLLKFMFPSWRNITLLLFFMLLLLVILEQIVIFQVGMLPSKFYKVLGNKDLPGFRNATLYSLLIIISISCIVATSAYVSKLLYITWRDNVTRQIHRLYFTDIFYYNVNILDESIDNPDQRITQDVDKTCQQVSEITANLLITPFAMVYYIYQCWLKTGYIGPLSVLVFFLVSTVFNKFLMTPVARLVFVQERQEGDFRFKHMSVRVNAESAAFFRSGPAEREKSNQRLAKLIGTMQLVSLRQYALNLSIQVASYLGSILSYVILAIPIFAGRYDGHTESDLAALISQNAFVTIYLIYCFTRLISMSVQVADIAGSTHRILELVERLQMMADKELDDVYQEGIVNPAESSSSLSLESIKSGYTLDGVTYAAPNSHLPLVKDLDLKVVSGVNLLVTGDSGCGKSSLLRVIDGLWPALSGSVQKHVKHGTGGVMFLPQRPFLTDGTLREQIIYPSRVINSTVDDTTLHEYLKEVDLMGLVDRSGGLDCSLSEDWNWYDMLSPGEMQRLSFVRLYYHQPTFAVLDEATSQIGVEAEKRLYQLCVDHDITVVSVGHRETLREFHDVELHLDGHGGWQLSDIHRSSNL